MQAECSLKHAIDSPLSTQYSHGLFLPIHCPSHVSSANLFLMAPDSYPLNGFNTSCIKPVIMGAFDHKWKPEIPSDFWVRGNLSSLQPSNHTRPSAQDMEVAVQNLVSWLILSVVLSDAPWFHQQEGRRADISSLAPQSASLAPE